MIEIVEEIDFSDLNKASPICLPGRKNKYKNTPGIVAGWGVTEDGVRKIIGI